MLLLLCGIRLFARKQLSDTEKEAFRTKAKRFRSKLRDALAVWDDEEPTVSSSREDVK